MTDPAQQRGEPAGIYVHLPFCKVKCAYCDFYSLAGQDDLADSYVDALIGEVRAFPEAARYNPIVSSVYIGGGTPTHLPPGSVPRVLEAIAQTFALDHGAEITVEANPESATRGRLLEIRGGGANRLSLGAQSFESRLLALMGRPHGPEGPEAAVKAARECGFDNVSLDLIYGLPGQEGKDWRRDLERAAALGPEHISAYLLETDKETPLARAITAGGLPEPEQDLVAGLFDITEETLASAGYSRYEVSNWARTGRECRHNLGYWNDRPYVGFGASSHSFYGGRRRACRLSAAEYIDAAAAGIPTRIDLDDGSRETRLTEAVITALRLSGGADFDLLGARYGTDLWKLFGGALEELSARGWAEVARPKVRLTRAGILWSLDALTLFVDEPPAA